MPKLKIETGHIKDIIAVPGNAVRFVAEDGRTMFEVTCGKDGTSIEVRAVELCRVQGTLYDTHLCIEPKVTNSVVIRTRVYD